MKRSYLLILGLICLASCSNNEDDTYPSIITEMADLYTDGEGVMEKFTTDAGVTYQIINGQGDLQPKPSIGSSAAMFLQETALPSIRFRALII